MSALTGIVPIHNLKRYSMNKVYIKEGFFKEDNRRLIKLKKRKKVL
jgi:hypothetical protein